MDDAERERIERACERLVVDYTHRTDMDGGNGLADLFASDGILDVGTSRLVGRSAIAAASAARNPALVMHHICTNVAIDVKDSERATGTCYLQAYVVMTKEGSPPPLGLPAVVGRYHDTFVRTPEGWRIAERVLVPVFRGG